MRVFEHANLSAKQTCPICKEAVDKPVVLIGIVGTEEGHNMQAVQVHLDCLDLLYYPEHNLIAQKLE